MNDPANLPFMEAIMRGQLPPELDPGDPSVQVGAGGWWMTEEVCRIEGVGRMTGVRADAVHLNRHLRLQRRGTPLPPLPQPQSNSPSPLLGQTHQQVNVNLLRRDEDYTPPAQPKVKVFTGTGYKLSGADDSTGAGSSGAAAPSGSGAAAPAAATPPVDAFGAVTWGGADPMLPTTSIQLRLADGSRLRAEFNLSHTVGDIRRWVVWELAGVEV